MEKPCLFQQQYVIDAGAYVGDTSLFMAKLLKHHSPHAKVIAIDPDPRNIDFINRMAKHNGLDNIITILGALGNQSRRVFLQASEAPNPGAKKVVAQDTTDHNSRNTVPMFTIDQIIQNLDISYNNVGFIHLDLEGWELPALVGSLGLLITTFPI